MTGVLLPVLAITALFSPRSDAATPTVCEAILIRTGDHGGGTTLSRVDLPSGVETPPRQSPTELNAVGYSSSQDLVYGIGEHGHVVRVTRSGGIADLGYPRGVPRDDLELATAGAVVGGGLVVRLDDRLFTIDITPSSRTYLSVTRVVRMRPEADGLDDFAVDPVDGLLYGVNSTHGPPVVVSVDPGTGVVRTVATPAGLPHGSSYGSAVIDSSRTLYVLDNDDGHRSRLFAIPRGGPARELSSAAPVGTSDAAGCLGEPVPAPPAPPPPPARTTTAPPPAPVPTAPAPPPPSPAPAPVVVPPPPVPQRPVVRPTTPKKAWTPVSTPVAQAADHQERTKQRHWALAAVILLVGGGAATHAAARARSR